MTNCLAYAVESWCDAVVDRFISTAGGASFFPQVRNLDGNDPMEDMAALIHDIQDAHEVLNEQDNLPPEAPLLSLGTGGTEEEITDLEDRLDIRLPPSYRAFLMQVNGCSHLGLSHGGLFSADRVKWFRADNQDWILAYSLGEQANVSEKDHRVYGPDQDCTRFRHTYLALLLQIGEVFDGSVYLLNPEVKDETGEWEAWCFSDSYPGACRWPSFMALVEDTWRQMRREARLHSPAVDEERILSEALPTLRRAIEEDGVSAPIAIARYIKEKADKDDHFAAWIRGTSVYSTLLRALKSMDE